MTHFPNPIHLPSSVFHERKERERQLVKSSVRGIALRIMIVIFELVGVMIFGSSALLMDAIASGIDILSSLLLVICIKLAYRPPDENHPFGHGRYEPLIGLQLGIMMAVIGAGVLFQQTFSLSSAGDRIIDPRTWMIPFCAVILLEISYQIVMRTARRQNSPALAADAVHYRIDGITSLFATVALVLAAYVPTWGDTLDHIGAILIALLMVGIGVYAARQNLHQIMDRTPDRSYFDRVKFAAEKVEGVLGTEKIRIQLYGPDAHVDIDIEVEPFLSVEVAHKISQQVRAEIQKDWSQVRDVTVHIEPFYPGDH